MKKFVINFISLDRATADDDGIFNSYGMGTHTKGFDTKEEAEKFLEEELIPTDKADLESNYCVNPEDDYYDKDMAKNTSVEVEEGCYNRKELNVYQDGDLINSTIYEISEVEF